MSRKRAKRPAKRPGPEGGTRDLNRRENVRRLREAGLALFLATGTATVTIDEIVERAEMSKGNFYRYAADKSELVTHIIAPVVVDVTHALDRCEQALHAAKPDALAAIYLQLAGELSAVVGNHAREVLLYLQEARAPAGGARAAIHALADLLTTRSISLTQVAADHGLIRDVDPRIAALTVTGAVDAILFEHLRGRRLRAAEISTITRELVTIVLRGVGGGPERARAAKGRGSSR